MITTSARITKVESSSTVAVEGSETITGMITAVCPIGVAVATAVGAADGATVRAGVGAGVAGPGVGPNVGTGVATTTARQSERVIVFVSSVTAPLRARSRPSMTAPVVAVMDVSAMIVPLKFDPVPSVAELPICQNTLQACAPPEKTTLLPLAVVNVEPAWKIHTSVDPPESVSTPVRASDDAEL